MTKAVLLRRLVISVVAAAALATFAIAFTLHEETPEIRAIDSAVRAVEPAPGEQRARQATVFFELASSYEGMFEEIDAHPIPEDQVDVIEGLNRYSFTPGEGKEFERFRPGRNCAVARFWPRGASPETGRTYTWCYSLH